MIHTYHKTFHNKVRLTGRHVIVCIVSRMKMQGPIVHDNGSKKFCNFVLRNTLMPMVEPLVKS